jgi:hypothetical protein
MGCQRQDTDQTQQTMAATLQHFYHLQTFADPVKRAFSKFVYFDGLKWKTLNSLFSAVIFCGITHFSGLLLENQMLRLARQRTTC